MSSFTDFSRINLSTYMHNRTCPASLKSDKGQGGRVVTLSPPTSKAGVQFTALPQVGKLVVACHWAAVYSTEP